MDSNFLWSECDDRVDQAENETNSWERDHSYNTGNVTADVKYLGEVETFGIDGIQGGHIIKYSKLRRPKVGMLPNCLFVGWCLKTLLWHDLVDFWRARESKCSMVLSILESLKT